MQQYCAMMAGEQREAFAEAVDAVQTVYDAIPKKIFKSNPDY